MDSGAEAGRVGSRYGAHLRSRSQTLLFPEAVDDYVDPDNPVRFIDAFVDGLDLTAAGFVGVEPRRPRGAGSAHEKRPAPKGRPALVGGMGLDGPAICAPGYSAAARYGARASAASASPSTRKAGSTAAAASDPPS